MRLFLCLLLLCCGASNSRAESLSFTGSLDPNNPNDVYLATFQVASASMVSFQSYGYGGSSNAPGGTNAAGHVVSAGGFDTYFSLFQGTGSTAAFLGSNDDGGCAKAAPVNGYCEDSSLAISLAAGYYTLALTLPGNFSFAENYGTGTLGDGFIGLQGDYYDPNSGEIRSSDFAFDITGEAVLPGDGTNVPPAATPEPASLALLATGLACLLLTGQSRARVAQNMQMERENS